MNILFVSNLSGWLAAGPTYSVPKQIETAALYDNIFWYNVCQCERTEWKKYEYYHDINEFSEGKIQTLPVPFNRPDLVIVEQFYRMAYTKIPYELMFGRIPYIIVPRGELTHLAQNNKKIKKIICNTLFFKYYAKKAVAIQYLTEMEKKESGRKWNTNCFVLPNGVSITQKPKVKYNHERIRCISIGRIDINHKGLDLLIGACKQLKKEFEENNCIIDIYGPDEFGQLTELQMKVNDLNIQNIIHFHPPIYGEEKKKQILASDVFVITSRYEGHPTAVIEALSFGIPVLATSGSNMENDILRSNSGWGAGSSIDSIREAFICMLKGKDEIQQKGENAFNLSKEYDWERIGREAHKVYHTIIRG